jgi:hypothetical protein
MSEILYNATILSVKDEIAKINNRKKATLYNCISSITEYVPLPSQSEESYTGVEEHLYDYSGDSDTSSISKASYGSQCSRARKGDTYGLVSDSEISRIVTEINSGRLVSNTQCAPWGPGHKHNPEHPKTLQVRQQLTLGPQTKEEIQRALPSIPPKHIRAILHELREQGIVTRN